MLKWFKYSHNCLPCSLPYEGVQEVKDHSAALCPVQGDVNNLLLQIQRPDDQGSCWLL